jgi:hypothetical protein
VWATKRVAAGHRLAVAEINDYEVRWELLRKNAHKQIRRLDELINSSEFLPIDRPTMLYAAELWRSCVTLASQPPTMALLMAM